MERMSLIGFVIRLQSLGLRQKPLWEFLESLKSLADFCKLRRMRNAALRA